MSNKKLAISTAIVLVLIVSAGFLVEVYLALERINPAATIAAITVALIGVVWMKKQLNPHSKSFSIFRGDG